MYSYLEKIDKSIIDKVNTQSISNYECIVYSKDYFSFRKYLLKSGKNFCELPFISAFGIKINAKDIITFAKKKIVTYIAKSTKVSTLAYIAKKTLNVDAFYAKGLQGAGGVVAIIDTGIFPHLDFVVPTNRILKFVDLINSKELPYDDNGHGTMVASLACGNGLVHNKKYSGMAPLSKIIAIKAIESNGETSVVKILEAMQWIYDNKRKYNISVACMSFGSEPAENYDPLVAGVEKLWNSGVCVVVAAGNSGPEKSSIRSPGISRKVITVGGFDDRAKEKNLQSQIYAVADFSSRGPVGNFNKPDLVAPAVNIAGASASGGYTTMSGTSVATPLIAGIASLMVSNSPYITPDQIKIRLVRCCDKISTDQNEDGFGVINCDKLFKN